MQTCMFLQRYVTQTNQDIAAVHRRAAPVDNAQFCTPSPRFDGIGLILMVAERSQKVTD